ncbi:hypothetical protein GGF31_003597 [Allomyces arbusculus]|nr:hypothetical protein GGF31_003597 [Allomyces arbusculus]
MYSDSDSDAASDFTSAAEGWTPTGDYLAFPDGKVSRSRAAKDLIDHTVSRLGGPAAPLAPNPPIPTPACAACARPLLLVAQLYAPLDDDEVRVLYVWGCNRRACMPRPGAWFVARGNARRRVAHSAPVAPRKDDEVDLEHVEDVVVVEKKVEEPQGIASVDKDLFHVADDVWGSAAEKPDATADPFGGFDTLAASADPVSAPDAPKGSDPFGGFGDALSKPASDPFAGFDVTTPTAAFAAPISDLKFSLTPKEVAAPPKPAKKAVPVLDPAPVAVAAPAAAASTPPDLATTTTTTTSDAVSLLDTQLASLSLGRADPTVFPAYYLLIEEEYIQSKLAKAAAYAHYQLGDGTLGDGDLVDGADSSSSAKPTSESYESTTIKGFTRTLEKFVERIEDNPGQVVRYRHGGRALHYSDFAVISGPPTKGGKPGAVPKCDRCGAARVFECQLMSTLLSVLPVEQYAAKAAGSGPVDEKAHPSTWYSGMEFGTVLVYTCGKNCAASEPNAVGGPVVEYAQEVCVVQLESE